MRVSTVGLSPKEIQEKFGVSRATAYRAAKRGYVCPNYHKREIIPDPKRAEEKLGLIVMIAEQTLWRKFRSIRNKADARSEVILRLLQLAGHPSFGEINWMISVAENRLRDFAKKERRYLRIASSLDRIIDYGLLPVEALIEQ